MTNTIDTRTAIAESDILAALTGIVNAHLADGIADGDRNEHRVSVVIWRNMGQSERYAIAGLASLSVIVHVDHESVAPFGGSYIQVDLQNLSYAATQIVVRAERLAADELDRREALLAALETSADNAMLGALASSPLNEAIHELAEEVTVQIRQQTQRGYQAAYTAFCLARNVVEDHPLSRRQYRVYILKTTGNPVPEFVRLGAVSV